MIRKAEFDEYVSVVSIRPRAWIDRIEGWDGSWFRVRFPLLVLSLVGLFYMYQHLPHRGAEPLASRYQTLTVTVQTVGKSRTAYDAFKNLQYLNVNYEDPGIYWLVHHIIALGKAFNPGWSPSETLVYPLQFCVLAMVLLMLSWRIIPINLFICGTAVFFLAFNYTIFYWSWDVYWAPAVAVLLTMTFLLSVTAWPEGGMLPWIAAMAYGLSVGLLGLIRQDSGFICQAAAFAFASCLLFYWLAMRGKDLIRRVHARSAILVLCFIAATTAPRLAFSAEVGLIQLIAPPHPALAGNMEHGKWHNVYLGIGFNVPPYGRLSNPYGIAWDDNIGALHAVEEDPMAKFGTPRYMPILRSLLTKVIYDDPAFFISTICARAYTELSLISSALPKAARVTNVLYLWPILFSTLLLHSGRRAIDGMIYLITAVTALIPPILTFPYPSYSTAIGMVLVASPLFFVGSFFENVRDPVRFRSTETRWLVAVVAVLLLVVTSVIACFAIEAKASNDRLLWDLVGPPTSLLAQIEYDSWRVDRHFNHSLSSLQRKTAAEKFNQVQGDVGIAGNASIREFPDASVRITNFIRLRDRIVLFVETNTDLNYAVFVLQADGSDHVFYRKALDWSALQTYALIFNTGPLDDNVRSFTLNLKEDVEGFTTEPGKSVAQITFTR
jgi:hypothetical protein